MVVRAATAACFLCSRGKLGNVGRNIKLRHVDDLVLGLGSVRVMPSIGRKIMRTKTLPTIAKASTWLMTKFSSFVQMSRTLMGLLVKFAGGNLAGKKNSFSRAPKPPKLLPQETASRLFTGPLGAGPERIKSLKFSTTPPPNAIFTNGASGRFFTFTGRSVRNCFRFDQKLSLRRILGAPNLGTAVAGTGTAGWLDEERPGFFNSAGTRLTIKPCTISP